MAGDRKDRSPQVPASPKAAGSACWWAPWLNLPTGRSFWVLTCLALLVRKRGRQEKACVRGRANTCNITCQLYLNFLNTFKKKPVSSIRQQTISVGKMWKKGNPNALLVWMQTGAATVENSMEVSKKIKNGTALWPSDSIPENTSEGTWNTTWKENIHPMFTAVLFTIAKLGKQPRCPEMSQ